MAGHGVAEVAGVAGRDGKVVPDILVVGASVRDVLHTVVERSGGAAGLARVDDNTGESDRFIIGVGGFALGDW